MNYILVTGSSSGIGQEIAIVLSQYYNIIIHGRNADALRNTKENCSQDHDVLVWNYDLDDCAHLESALSSFIIEHNIEVSGFVHCAGFCKNLPLKMANLSVLQSTFNINVFSGFLISKTLYSMKVNKKNLNNIVFISSNISGFGAKAHSIYGASKMAVDGMMKSLAVELAPRVRVNSVLPGAVETSMTKNVFADEELIQRMESTYPLGLGFVRDIANIVVFLLSENSRWITGQQITVDGGRTVDISG